MKKIIRKIAAITLAAVVAAALLAGYAFAADDVVYRTVDEIKESGTINIGVFSDKSPFGFLSPGDLPDPGIQPGLLHFRQILYCLSHQGSP